MIQKGQNVHCILYGGRDGIVFEIHGEQHPETIKQLGGGCMVMGGSADFDIVFEDGTISRRVPESIVHGVQWRIYKEIAGEGEIKAALDYAERVRAVAQEKAEQEAAQFTKDVAALPGLFPYLIPRTKAQAGVRLLSSAAVGAKNIKVELGRTFPSVKFSVKSQYFSGGDSIDIGWTDGPTERMVDETIGKYQEGHFDGMDDSYNYKLNHSWSEVFGGAKYVSCQRRESEVLVRKAAAELDVDSLDFSKGYIQGLPDSEAQEIYRLARTMAT